MVKSWPKKKHQEHQIFHFSSQKCNRQSQIELTLAIGLYSVHLNGALSKQVGV